MLLISWIDKPSRYPGKVLSNRGLIIIYFYKVVYYEQLWIAT